MSLPKELNLGSNKPMSSGARPQILRFRSDNSSYTGGDTIRIEIPTGRQGQYMFQLDSFLEFKLAVNTTSAPGTAGAAGIAQPFYLDGSIYSLFNRIRILHGSTVLEDTLYANRLWNALFDLLVNEAERKGAAINMGVLDNSSAAAIAPYNNGLFGRIVYTTEVVPAGTLVGTTTDTIVDTFNFVIPSSVFGSLAQKALPLSLLGASSLYIELELAAKDTCFIKQTLAALNVATLNSYTVSDIYYNAKVSILPIEVESALIQSTGGIINLPAVSYKVEQKTISTASMVFNDKFSFQYSSIKNFLFWVQNSTSANDIYKRSITSRPKANISEFYLNLNGELYPSQSINSYARMYAELTRSFDGLTDTNFGGILTLNNYSLNLATTATDVIPAEPSTCVQKRFIGGLDLDRFNHSSDTLMSGTSTIGQMLSLVVNMSAGTNDTLNLYGCVMYDVLYNIQNGQMISKF